MRPLALAAVVAAAVAAAASADPQAFAYDRELGAVARRTLRAALVDDPRFPGRRIERVGVRCYQSQATFEHAFRHRFGVSARRVIAYYAGGPDVHLRSTTCANVRLFLRGRHTVFTAAAFAILLHEALHRQGVRDERITTCLSSEAVRWGALRYGFSEERALRARNLAFAFTKRYSPRSYVMGRPTCLALARNTSWPDHVAADRR